MVNDFFDDFFLNLIFGINSNIKHLGEEVLIGGTHKLLGETIDTFEIIKLVLKCFKHRQ